MGEEHAVRTLADRQLQRSAREKTDGNRAKRKIADYFCANFYVTTSGNFSTQALIHTILQMGSDRVMFSVDWPFEEIEHAATWFDGADISENDRRKIGRDNAARLLKLKCSSKPNSPRAASPRLRGRPRRAAIRRARPW